MVVFGFGGSRNALRSGIHIKIPSKIETKASYLSVTFN